MTREFAIFLMTVVIGWAVTTLVLWIIDMEFGL